MQHFEPRPANRRHPAPVSLVAATLLAALGVGTQAQTLAPGTAPAAAPGFPAPAVPAAGVASAPAHGLPGGPAVAAPQGMLPTPGVSPVAPAVAAPPAGTTPVQPFPGAAMGAPGYNAAVPQPVRPDAMPQPGRPAFAAPPPAARAPVPALPTVQSPPVKGLPADAPKLVINGGVHSPNPARRRVIVNGQVVREGADLGAGVVLEQIKPDSVVLGFRGEHFHVMY
ncbi:hypothetical protein RAMLITH_07900 [Ramlibacter sp. RBP-2]|uniref:Type II secretion system protein GspB C-terminal domain-containing protein n=1 Tax=Ramlibacter lithotrophicus TaxID=2606681 RepID=A0A7X6DEQ7_9BURK|nr:general secretion pathway protein GspB [Ramlibacter lithotrophicus]NKE65743.1 hypothetical protein [Ramlibacter lithotrophicus]